MAVIGIERVYLGIFDEEGNPVTDESAGFTTGAIEVTNDMLGTSAVNFQVSKNGEEIDGNNREVGYIKSLPTAQMDVQFNDLPFDVQNKLLGRVKQGVGWVDSMTNTYVGIVAKAPHMNYKDYTYYVLPKAVPTPKGKNMQTNTSKKTNRIIDEFSFEGLASDKANGMPYMTASTTDDGFTEKGLFDQIFPGQTLITTGTKPGDTASVSNPGTVDKVTQ